MPRPKKELPAASPTVRAPAPRPADDPRDHYSTRPCRPPPWAVDPGLLPKAPPGGQRRNAP
jgi:hypothetical protein